MLVYEKEWNTGSVFQDVCLSVIWERFHCEATADGVWEMEENMQNKSDPVFQGIILGVFLERFHCQTSVLSVK